MPTLSSLRVPTFALVTAVFAAGFAGCGGGSTALAPVNPRTAAPTPSLPPDSVRATLSGNAATTIRVFPLNGITGTVTFAAPSPAVTGVVATVTITTVSNLGGSSLQPDGMRRDQGNAPIDPLNYYSFLYTCNGSNYVVYTPCYGNVYEFPPSLLFDGFTPSEVPPGYDLFAAAFGPGSATPISTEQIPLSNGNIAYVPHTHIYLTNGDVYGFSLYAQAAAATPTPSPSPTATPPTSQSGLSNPVGLAVDSSNNLYVADSGNNRIVVYDVNGAPVSLDTNAVDDPGGITIDPSNNLWVTNRVGNTVTEYADGNLVASNTIALGTTGPSSIAVDASGYVFVGVNGPQPGIYVYKTSMQQKPSLVATVTTDGSGTAIIPGAMALASYDGQEFVIVGNGSASPNSITAYSAAQIEAAQDPAPIYTVTAGISGPTGIAINAAQTALYVSDLYTGDVTVYSQSGSSVAQSGTISQSTGYCAGVAVNSLGDVYVSNDGSLDDITEYNASGSLINTFAVKGAHR